MKYSDFPAYKIMREGARDPDTLARYLSEGRGMYEAFRKGWDGFLPPLCLYARGTIQAACAFAGRDARRELER